MNSIPTQTQVSAGGVAFRKTDSRVDVALISVGLQARWQLPKGMINPGETNEEAALREVREEAGIETELLAPIDKIEYFYYSTGSGGRRVRFHKYVHFFLMRYRSGDPMDHDHEVNEARWTDIDEAYNLLRFDSEKHVIERARELNPGAGSRRSRRLRVCLESLFSVLRIQKNPSILRFRRQIEFPCQGGEWIAPKFRIERNDLINRIALKQDQGRPMFFEGGLVAVARILPIPHWPRLFERALEA